MLSVVVIDDELLALNLLSYLLDNFTSVQLKVVGKAMNLADGIIDQTYKSGFGLS